jgi:hypothetical protein
MSINFVSKSSGKYLKAKQYLSEVKPRLGSSFAIGLLKSADISSDVM